MEVHNKEDYSGSSDDTEVPLAPLESGYISDSDSQPPSSSEQEEEEEPGIDNDDDTTRDQLDDTSMDITTEVHVKEEEIEEKEEEKEEDTTTTCCPLEQPQHTNEEPMMMPTGRPVKLPLKMRLLSFNDDDSKAVNAVDEAVVKGRKEKKMMPKGWLPRVALEIVSREKRGGQRAVAPVIVEEGEGEVKKVGYNFMKPAMMIKSSVSGGGGMKTKSIIQVKREQERALKAVLEQASFHL